MTLSLIITLIEVQRKQQNYSLKTKSVVLFKFGSKQIKCLQFQNPSMANLDNYLYQPSKSQSIKSIIKIYKVDTNNHEIIESVGTLNLQFLQQQGQYNVESEVGIYKIKFQVSYQFVDEQDDRIMRRIFSQRLINKQRLSLSPSKFNKNKRTQEYDGQQTYCVGESQSHISRFDDISVSNCTQFMQEIKLNEENYIGQQLILERRQNRLLQEKIANQNIKINNLKKKLGHKKEIIKSYIQGFEKFTGQLQSNSKGQYIFQINQRKRQLTIKYKNNVGFKQNFFQFLNFMVKQIYQSSKIINSSHFCNHTNPQKNEENQSSQNQQLKIIQLQSSNRQLSEQILEVRNQVEKLVQQISQKNTQLQNLSISYRQLQQDMQAICKMNDYLQEKDKKNQELIQNNNESILELRKTIQDNNIDLDTLELKNNQLYDKIRNLELRIQENKEEISDLNETIQSYRKKFGDLKPIKDKAIELEIKECLMWIDQKRKQEEEQEFLDTLDSMISLPEYISRGLENIDKLPTEELAELKKQVMYALKKIETIENSNL